MLTKSKSSKEAARLPSAGKTAPAVPPPSQGAPVPIKLWDTPEKVAGLEGVKLKDGVLAVERRFLAANSKPVLNSSVRAKVQISHDAKGAGVRVRRTGERGADSYYRFGVSLNAKNVTFACMVKGQLHANLLGAPLPGNKGIGDWVDLKLQIVGNELSVWIDGQPAGVFHDATLTEPGETGIFTIADGFFSGVEYVPLDKAP